MPVIEHAPEVYYQEPFLHAGRRYNVKFVYRRWELSADMVEELPITGVRKAEVWAVLSDDQGIMFAAGKRGRHPKERRRQTPLPQMIERHLLTALRQRLDQGRWRRGASYDLADDWSPELVSEEDLCANVVWKLGCSLDELLPLTAKSAPATGGTRDDVALQFDLPVTEPLGRQLEQRGVLTHQEALFTDSWPELQRD